VVGKGGKRNPVIYKTVIYYYMMRYRTRMPGRVWLKTEGMEYDLSLKVMSYNILAPCYSYFSLFSHVDKP